jgi:hypothetical protein
MHRPTLGAITILLLAIGLYYQWAYPQGERPLASACLRVGVVMAALWLAQPQLALLPRWLLIVVMVALGIVAWRPQVLWVALPVVLVLWLLRPRKRIARGEKRDAAL